MSSGRTFGDPEIIHINLKGETPVINEIHISPQRYIEVPIIKKGYEQARYRDECMAGADHPMEIERQCYTLVTVHTQSMDTSIRFEADSPMYRKPGHFTEMEIEFINSIQRRPEVEWAIDNSFDGIYVQKYEDPSRFATSFKFAVYMKNEQVTFWKLKYHGK